MVPLLIIIYIALTTGLNQFYKVTTRTMKNPEAQVAGVLAIGSLFCLFFIPFFGFRMPTDPLVYILLIISCILYSVFDRLTARVRKNLEASVMGIMQQIYTALMTISGFVLFGEEATPFKIIGAALIIGGNLLVFWHHKKSKKTKYVFIGVLSYLLTVAAGLIDIRASGEFNIAFYTSLTFFIPAIVILLTSKIRLKDIADEFKRSNKVLYLLASFCWGVHYLVLLIAYSIGDVSVIAPLASMHVFVNVLVGYFWLKEKKNMPRKIVAALLAIIGVALISL